jgi:multidrug resistance efflux pump
MKIGSPTHRKEYLHNLIKIYQENIWANEITIFNSETEIALCQKQIKEIEQKLEAKEYKTANEGNKAKFVLEREIEHIKKMIDGSEANIAKWIDRIASIESIQKNESSKKTVKQK